MSEQGFVRTGVFATEEEAAEITRLHRIADGTPAMTLGLGHESFDAAARRHANEYLHRAAMTHGLRDHDGYYGIDESNREFLAPKGWTP